MKIQVVPLIVQSAFNLYVFNYLRSSSAPVVAGPLKSYYAGPFVNDMICGPDSDIQSPVEPTYPGYSEQSEAALADPVRLPSGGWQYIGSSFDYYMDNSAPAVPTLIKGFWFYLPNFSIAPFVAAGRLPQPIEMVKAGDGFTMQVKIAIGPAVPLVSVQVSYRS